MNLAGFEFAFQLDKLSICYDGRWVLKDFSLDVFQGEKIVLTGPSGSGKSTVLRCILGLVVPDSGTVAILGQTITSHNIWEKRHHIAYVAQEPDLGSGSVREVIEQFLSGHQDK
ncbi:MAG: ATP-binding cassette domain-containing protein [Desulfovermiculus sp.]